MNCTNNVVNCNSTPVLINETFIAIISCNESLAICNNTDDIIGSDKNYVLFRNQSRFWVQRVLVPIIMIIGVIGNSITIVIMTRRRMRSSTNSYLAALATFDMLYLIFTFVLSLSHYPNIKDVKYYYYWYLWPFAVMICDASSNTSIWLTVTFTIERYIAVCHPIRGKVLCTESRAKRVILCVFLICFTFTIPTPFEWTILERNETKSGNTTYLEATFSDFGQNDLYKTVYYYLNVILFALIPFLLLAIFNAFLIRSVHISRKQRNTLTQADSSLPSSNHKPDPTSKQEARITIMLIAVVILFFMCQLPTACVLIYSVFYDVVEETNKGLLIRGLGNIFNFLMAINAAGNFVLYCLLSQKYRRTFVTIFCPCVKGKFQRLQSVYQKTVYTHVVDHKAHHLRDKQLINRYNYNDKRPSSSPRVRAYPANYFSGADVDSHHSFNSVSTGRPNKSSELDNSPSSHYLNVPNTGSDPNLAYDSGVGVDEHRGRLHRSAPNSYDRLAALDSVDNCGPQTEQIESNNVSDAHISSDESKCLTDTNAEPNDSQPKHSVPQDMSIIGDNCCPELKQESNDAIDARDVEQVCSSKCNSYRNTSHNSNNYNDNNRNSDCDTNFNIVSAIDSFGDGCDNKILITAVVNCSSHQ